MKEARAREDLMERISALHELSDDAFEEERKRIIEEEISKHAPGVQERLRKFQWTLDMKRKKCKNPLEACFMFHELLMEQVYGENGLLENLQRFLETATELKGAVSSQAMAGSINGKGKTARIKTTIFNLSDFSKAGSRVQKRVSGR